MDRGRGGGGGLACLGGRQRLDFGARQHDRNGFQRGVLPGCPRFRPDRRGAWRAFANPCATTADTSHQVPALSFSVRMQHTPAMSSDPKHNQTLIAAENGPVIEVDATGLVLRLSDRVIRDIARRIGLPAGTKAAPPAGEAELAAAERLDPAMLGDIDAWDLQREGEWLRFVAHRPGATGARRYRKAVAGGGVIAETPGPVLGLLSLDAGWPRSEPDHRRAGRQAVHPGTRRDRRTERLGRHAALCPEGLAPACSTACARHGRSDAFRRNLMPCRDRLPREYGPSCTGRGRLNGGRDGL